MHVQLSCLDNLFVQRHWILEGEIGMGLLEPSRDDLEAPIKHFNHFGDMGISLNLVTTYWHGTMWEGYLRSQWTHAQ